MRSIYVVDNAENTGSTISQYLLREGFRVESFTSVDDLMLRLECLFPDMFIFDIEYPLKSLQPYYDISIRSGLPVIFTAANCEAFNQFRDLAVDRIEFLIKPFSPRELVSKVRSGFRHASLPLLPEKVLEIGNLKINPNDRHTTVDLTEVMLTPQEYELLLLLAEQPQRTFNRQEILDRIWGYDYVGGERAVDNLVKRLRKKLKANGSIKNVKTVWGCGYRFDE